MAIINLAFRYILYLFTTLETKQCLTVKMKMKAINFINIVCLTNHYTVWYVSIILRSHVWIIALLEFFVWSVPKGSGDSIFTDRVTLFLEYVHLFHSKKNIKFSKYTSLPFLRWNVGETPADLGPNIDLFS